MIDLNEALLLNRKLPKKCDEIIAIFVPPFIHTYFVRKYVNTILSEI